MNLRMALLLLVASPAPALADLTAKYVVPKAGFTMTVEIATNGDIHGDVGRPGQSFITRAGHGYFIQSGPTGPAVMRVEDMGTVMAEQTRKLDPKFREEMQQHAPTIKLVQKGTMTINGRTGAAFFMQAPNGSLSPMPWAVISSDPALAPLGAAMVRQFEMSLTTMSSTMGTRPFANMLAVLRTGAPIFFTGAELASISTAPIPSSRFELPAKPATLDEVRAVMSHQAPSKP